MCLTAIDVELRKLLGERQGVYDEAYAKTKSLNGSVQFKTLP